MAVEGLMSVIDPVCVTVILAGVAIGIIFGSIPGLRVREIIKVTT